MIVPFKQEDEKGRLGAVLLFSQAYKPDRPYKQKREKAMRASEDQLKSRAEQIRKGYRVRVTLDLLAGAVVGTCDGDGTTAIEPAGFQRANECSAERIPAALETAV